MSVRQALESFLNGSDLLGALTFSTMVDSAYVKLSQDGTYEVFFAGDPVLEEWPDIKDNQAIMLKLPSLDETTRSYFVREQPGYWENLLEDEKPGVIEKIIRQYQEFSLA